MPGSAERIIQQFEAEADHRRDMESRQVRYVVRDGHVGQALAGIFAIGAFSLAAYALAEGAHAAAAIIGGATIGTGIAAFLRSKK